MLRGAPQRIRFPGGRDAADRRYDALEALLQLVSQVPSAIEAWRRSLVPLIREGRTTLAELARLHHTSPRSLQRRLADQGTTFQALLDETRRHLAEAHLKEGRLDLAEIALLLGYSEQSAFTRAFRAWTGQPPAQWRRAQLRGASLPGASVHTPAP